MNIAMDGGRRGGDGRGSSGGGGNSGSDDGLGGQRGRGDNLGSVTLATISVSGDVNFANGVVSALLGWSATALLRGPSSKIVLDEKSMKNAAMSGLFGMLAVGGVGTFWHTLLDDLVVGTPAGAVALKTVLDVLVWIPFLGMAHNEYQSALRKRGWSARNSSASAVLGNRLLWIPAQVYCFATFPGWQRVSWLSGVVFFLSILAKLTGRNEVLDEPTASSSL
jgi:hypothetical protein